MFIFALDKMGTLFELETLEEIKEAFEQGATVDERDDYGQTPIFNGHSVAITQFLIDHEANVNARDNRNQTPLHGFWVIPEVVRLLILYGANVHAKDNEGRIPLHHCENPESAEILILAGSDVNARDNHGNTPLHTVENEEGAPEAIQVLITYGADVNARNDDGEISLSHVRTDDTARILIRNGAIHNGQYEFEEDEDDIIYIPHVQILCLIPYISSSEHLHCSICDKNKKSNDDEPKACPNCKNYICKQCIESWKHQKEVRFEDITCPYCRFLWT